MQLTQLLQSLELEKHAPTERWNPPYCGEIPIEIKANGDWYYQDSKIGRHKLVQLFASVLTKQDGDYFLVTPAEKVKIKVVDAPFIVTEWRHVDSDAGKVIQVTTNIGEQRPLSDRYPLFLKNQQPYVELGHELTAKVHRNVYYQWAEIATLDEATDKVMLHSGACAFELGQL